MKKAILLFPFIVILLIGCSQVKPEDVLVEAKLTINKNEEMSYKDYMLDIFIEKEHGDAWIYPYMKNLENMSFGDEDDSYYTPNNISVITYDDEEMVINELKKHNFNLDDFESSKWIGFHIPKEKGAYNLRIYFEKGDGEIPNDLYLIYLHKEESNKWSKLIEIQSEIGEVSE